MISQSELKNRLHYEPSTGVFSWIGDQRSGVKSGDIAGSKNGDGYIIIMISGKSYLAHRLAMLYEKGEAPKKSIDHINGKRSDNRMCNLREASTSENGQNMRLLDNNTSGFKGVNWSKGAKKWRSTINMNGKKHHLGYYDDLELAGLVSSEARVKFFGDYNRATTPHQ